MTGERSRSRVLSWLVATLLAAAACTTVPVPQSVRAPAPTDGFDHADLDEFLRKHVDGSGRVDYAGALRDRKSLRRYVAAIAASSPDSDPARFPKKADRLAYWINAYNAWTLHLVLEHYPVGSVHEIKDGLARAVGPVTPNGAGFFFFQRILLGGKRTSLYALENSVVRRRFAEPRIHFALNCASVGCPRLPPEAFRPDDLEEQLARETARFLGEHRNVEVDAQARTLHLSAIFEWYADDFQPSIPEWITDAAAPGLRAALTDCADCALRSRPYDWRLNDQAAD